MIFTLKIIFDLYASLIFSVLYGTNKVLRAIALLFNSDFFQSFWCDGSSNINEVIKTVLNFLFIYLFIFLRKDFKPTKKPKKHKKALKP